MNDHRAANPYERPRPPRDIPHLLVPEKAIDFVELDPNRDVAEITTRTFGSAVLTFLAGLFLRTHDDWRGYDQSPIRD